MPSLPQLIDSPAVIAPAEVNRRADSARRPVSDEAVRLALRLRDLPSSGGGRTLLFVPVSAPADVSTLVADAVSGLRDLQEGPVFLMDLRVTGEVLAPPSDQWLAEFSFPFAGRRDPVPYAASPEFAAVLARARVEYPFVICVGGAIASSVETLIAAPLCDGVVLSVAPGKTTRSDMQRVAGQLRRARANVIGFVVDARSSAAGI